MSTTILKSMREYVLEHCWLESGSPNVDPSDRLESFRKIMSYAEFLSMPLMLGMFVPCDKKGNVLKEPKEYRNWLKAIGINQMNYFADGYFGCLEYQKALDDMIFDEFHITLKIYDFCRVEMNDKDFWLTFGHNSINVESYDEFKGHPNTIEDFLNLINEKLSITQSAITKYQI